ncbi:MAG: hypothetical protein HY046_14510, partial [Acidobacteria bacterium]|nr:hypothetical protein [Acidobacteriota bacterium]
MRKTILIVAAILGVTGASALLEPSGLGAIACANSWKGSLTVLNFVTAPSTVEANPGQPIQRSRHRDDDEDVRMPVRDAETIRKTFDLGTGARSIEIDNVTGSIEVLGTDSNQVSLTVSKSIRAETQVKLDEARKEVTLDITHEGGVLKLFMNGPFRCRCAEGWNLSFGNHPGYSVKMDFQIQVPRNTDFRLSTVNDGNIRVSDLRGKYSVRNVNGGIEMNGVAGSGTAHTVNGGVKVVFRENPREDSSFKSINGDIDLYFARGLSADFRFKTFNGSVYSDFAVTSLPLRSVQEERNGRK